jgi:hypothetical protein
VIPARPRLPRLPSRGRAWPLFLGLALLPLGACDGEEPQIPYGESRPKPKSPPDSPCYILCCRERQSPCIADLAHCGGCQERCTDVCADARALVSCLEAANASFVCDGDGDGGSLTPANDVCRQEFTDYQAATRACGKPEAAVGGVP